MSAELVLSANWSAQVAISSSQSAMSRGMILLSTAAAGLPGHRALVSRDVMRLRRPAR
jgi:hypothetical protein